MSSVQSKKILAVFGATGYQGGSVVKHLSQNPTYSIRALTRDPTSTKAQTLSTANPGISIQRGDLSDPSSLQAALQDVHAVYLVTDFFATLSPETEFQQARNALDIIAKTPTIEHVIWSALPSISDLSGGKYTNVVHFDGKARVTKWLEEAHPELWSKTTTLWVGIYFQLWLQFPHIFAPKHLSDGVFGMRAPVEDTIKLPMVDVRDTGIGVNAILERGTKQLGGKTVSLIGDDKKTLGERVKDWGEVAGKKTGWEKISDEEFVGYLGALGLPELLVKDMADLFAAFREFGNKIGYGDGVVMAKEITLGKGLKSWEEYVKEENWEPLLKQE